MNKLSLFVTRLLTGFLFTSFLLSCDYRPQDVDLREDEELREDVYHQILNDEELFSEFLRELSENPRSLEQMVDDPEIGRYMYSLENLRKMMQNDPVLIDTIHTRMQQDPLMRRRMFDNMQREMGTDTARDHEMQEIIE